MKIVRIQYTIREGVDLDEVKARIATFVAGIAQHDPGHRYTSHQVTASPREFVHIGAMAADRTADLQAQPFFGAFSGYLREHCEKGPDVTWLEEVASTR